MINEHKKGVKAVKYTKKSKGIEPMKPRNFVAKNAINTGAGAHKDKKKAAKQGDVKHKKQEYTESLEVKLQEALSEAIPYDKKTKMVRAVANKTGWGVSDLSLSSDAEITQMYQDYVANPTQPASNKVIMTTVKGKDKLTKMLTKLSPDQLVGYYKNMYKSINGQEPEVGEREAQNPNWLIKQIQSMSSPYMAKKRRAFDVDEAGDGSNRGYHQGFASPTAPRLGRGREDDEYHNGGDYDPELERNRKETMMYNVTVDGKPVTPKPVLGRSAAIAWAKEQIAAGKLDPKVAKLSPVQYDEGWSQKYKKSINCSHPKGFSQKAHCAGKKKHNESIEMEAVCPDCGMCQTHGSLNEIKKGQKDSNGFTKCWPGHHAAGTKKGKNGGQVRNCVPNEGVAEGWTHDTLAAQLFETPSYENRLKEMLEGAVAFMEGGTEDGVTMFSKEPGHHRKEAGYDKGEYDEEGGMIKNDLQTIVRVASRLEKVIDEDENLPTWVIEKIAQSKGMIVSVVDYIISQHEMGVKPQQK